MNSIDVISLRDGIYSMSEFSDNSVESKVIEDRLFTLATSYQVVDKSNHPIQRGQIGKIVTYVQMRFLEGIKELQRVSKKISGLEFSLLLAPRRRFVILTSNVIGKGSFKTVSDAFYVELGKRGKVTSNLMAGIKAKAIRWGKRRNDEMFCKFENADLFAEEVNSPYVVKKSVFSLEYKSKMRKLKRVLKISERASYDLRCVIKEVVKKSFNQLVIISADAAQGIADIHAKDLMHCDIKEENIFIQNSIAVIGDLDFCKTIHEVPKYVEGTGICLSPEIRLSKEKHLGCKAQKQPADIWALGLVFYKLFHPEHLEPPFFQNVHSNSQVNKALLALPEMQEKSVLFENWEADSKAKKLLQMLIIDMLKKNPDKRPCAQEIADRLILLLE